MSNGMEVLGLILPELAGAVLRGALLLGCAGVLTLALRRSTAALRHLVWTGAVAAVLALPVLGAVVPRLAVPVPALAASLPVTAAPLSEAARAEAAATDPSLADRVVAHAAVAADRDAPAAAAGRSPAVRAGLDGAVPAASSAAAATTAAVLAAAGVWLAGVVALLLAVGAGWVGVRRLEGRSSPVEDARLRRLATRLALRIGLRREFRLVMGPAGVMPMTWGIRRATVLLPPEAMTWPAARLEAVLLHELAHVKRRDCLTQLLAELVRAVHWFDPLAWVAARRLRVEREHACDDMALAGGARPSEYAGELLGLARSYRASATTGLAAVAMARPGQLADRLLAVLDEHRCREGLRRGAVLRTGGAVAALALVVAAAAPVDAPAAPLAGEAAVTEASTLPPGEVTSPALPVEPPSPIAEAAAPAVQDPSCAAVDADWETHQHLTGDDHTTILLERRGCALEVRLEGDVRFDPAAMNIERLGEGARLRIEEDNGRTERYLEVRPGPGGAPSFEYRVDGRTAAFDGQAQAWYRSVLLTLFRSAGFAAEERVRSILARDGVAGVLREMDQLRSGYVQARYFRELVGQAELSEDQYRTVLRQARQRIDSDHYLSEILQAVARSQPLTPRLLDEYVAAALALDSDHYRAETLRTAITSGRLTGAQVAAVLEGASAMSSDHYRSELLGQVADRYALEPAFRPAYLRAAAGMDSDHYRTQVLARLLRRTDLSPGELAEVVAAASMIGSDHYRTEILRQVATRDMSDPAIQRAYFQAVEGIGSDHYALEGLRGLIRQERLSADLLQTVLTTAARSIESDHYLSELLVEIAGRFTLEGRTREAFLRAMESVGSSHYRSRVGDALLRAERG